MIYICNTGNERSAGCTANSFSVGSALEKIRGRSAPAEPGVRHGITTAPFPVCVSARVLESLGCAPGRMGVWLGGVVSVCSTSLSC